MKNSEQAKETATSVQSLLEELKNILHGIELVRECSPRSMDLVMSFGERLSCTIIAAYLTSSGTKAEYIDARECVVTDQRHGAAVVNFDITKDMYGHVQNLSMNFFSDRSTGEHLYKMNSDVRMVSDFVCNTTPQKYRYSRGFCLFWL